MSAQYEVVFQGQCRRCGTTLRVTHPRHKHCCSWGGCNGYVDSFHYVPGTKIKPDQLKRLVLDGVMLYDPHRMFFTGFASQLGVVYTTTVENAQHGVFESEYTLTDSSVSVLFDLARNPDMHLLKFDTNGISLEREAFRFYMVSTFPTLDAFWENACAVFNENGDFRDRVRSIFNSASFHTSAW